MASLEEKFLLAAYRGDLQLLNRYIEDGVDLNVKNKLGHTALMRATSKGHKAAVVTLIDAGAYMNVRAVNGATTFYKACEHQEIDIALILIECGADVLICPDYDEPLVVAARFIQDVRFWEAIRDLFVCGKLGRSFNPLLVALRFRNDIAIDILLQDGLKFITSRDCLDDALNAAVSGNRIDVASALIQNGAVPNQYHISTAANVGSHQTIEFLLENGAPVQSTEEWKSWPLIYAARRDTVLPLLAWISTDG
jgi:ankyrin repeat protein